MIDHQSVWVRGLGVGVPPDLAVFETSTGVEKKQILLPKRWKVVPQNTSDPLCKPARSRASLVRTGLHARVISYLLCVAKCAQPGLCGLQGCSFLRCREALGRPEINPLQFRSSHPHSLTCTSLGALEPPALEAERKAPSPAY